MKVGKLNLVDLAGSERVHITGATGNQPLSHGSCLACRSHQGSQLTMTKFYTHKALRVWGLMELCMVACASNIALSYGGF